jgi:hypothetical protein
MTQWRESQSANVGGVEEAHENANLQEIDMGVAEVAFEKLVELSLLEKNEEGVEVKEKRIMTLSKDTTNSYVLMNYLSSDYACCS